jgi:hypothetical protein
VIGSVRGGLGSVRTAQNIESQPGAGPGSITQVTSPDGSVTITNPFGPVVGLEVAAPGASTLAAAYAAGLAGTPNVDNAFASTTASSAGPELYWDKSRAGAAVQAGDYLGRWQYRGWDGTTKVQGVQAGARVSRGATVAAGSVPSEFYIFTGDSTDPFATATNPVGFKAMRNTYSTPNYRTIFAFNFPSNVNPTDLLWPATVTNESATLNVWAPPTQQPLGGALTQWRETQTGSGGTGLPTYTGHIAWAFRQHTAGHEYSYFELELTRDGTPFDALRVECLPSTTYAKTLLNGRYGFSSASSPEIGITAGLGTQFDTVLYPAGGSTVEYRWGQYGGAGGRFFRVNAAAGAASDVLVGAQATGMFYETTQGGMYLSAQGSSVQIGAPGTLAAAATSGFFAFPTSPGLALGVPGFLGAGKTATYMDTTNQRFKGYFGAWQYAPFWQPAVTRAVGSAVEPYVLDVQTVTFTGTGSTSAYNAFLIKQPVLNSGLAVNVGAGAGGVATLKIEGGPRADSNVTITNSSSRSYGLWIADANAAGVPNLRVDGRFFCDLWAPTPDSLGSPMVLAVTNATGTFQINYGTGADGAGGTTRMQVDATGIGFLGAPGAAQQTGGAATAGGTYGATEQMMLQKVYDCQRTFGFLS